jgi:short-subunit dehydrogenase involved in D-alanine esterification of teichoic acids
MRSGGTRSLEGRTALVTGGGTILGRAIALALSARGVRIVVTGHDEKALGETVGEVVYGGGKARHLAGDSSDPAHLAAAVERATTVFGSLDIVVVADGAAVETVLSTLEKRIGSPGRVLVALAEPASAVSSLVREVALSLRDQAITCNAILLDPAVEEDGADDAAELAVYLCSGAGERITGQTIALGQAARSRAR